jgi:FkbM family methyltransferase
MDSANLRGQLDELFAPGAGDRAEAARERFRKTVFGASKILIYGSGRTGRSVAQALRSAGLPLLGFVDDTPSKQGTKIAGYPVWSPATARQLHGEDALVVVAIFVPGHSFRGSRQRLQALGFLQIVSVFAVAACFPEQLLPFYFFDRQASIFAARDAYYSLFDTLLDQRSQEELVRHLKFRLHVDSDALPEPVGLDYSYLGDRLPDTISFIDGGAFDGDSLQAFFKLVGTRFSNVLAFEPDACNFRKLTAYWQGLPDAIRRRVELCNAGLWSATTRLHFEATGTLGSTVGRGDGMDIRVVALDDDVRISTPLFIKYDVEGAEREALLGARRLLARGDATLAVAVYHYPDDLWALPALIRQINPTYRFGLRSHMDDGADLMLYAIPLS